MTTLQEYSKKFIKKVKNNIYLISPLNDKDLKEFAKEMINEKLKVSLEKHRLFPNEFALVRIMSPQDFPKRLEFHTLHADHKTANCENPFEYILEYIQYDIAEYKEIDIKYPHNKMNAAAFKIKYPLYRRTKHFSLNGLVSNVGSIFGSIQVLNNKEIIVIDPLINHLNDNLVNINPVDTFFNLENTQMKISEEAAFIIDYKTYKNLIKDPNIFEDLSKVKIFLYKQEDISFNNYHYINEQTFITDIVLAYLGYLPQHSKQQSILESEYYIEDHKIIEDIPYLNLFKNSIETLSQERLNQSYLNIPNWAKKRRQIYNDTILDVPGILHADTDIYQEDSNKDLENKIKSCNEYLDYLVDELDLDKALAYKLNITFSKHLKKNYQKSFVTSYYARDLEKDMINFLNKVGYKKLLEITQQYNNLLEEKLKNNKTIIYNK